MLAVLAAVGLLLAGCGSIVHQTRYIPRTSEIAFAEDYEQLPWQPPALGEVHYPRTERSHRPRIQHQYHYGQAFKDAKYLHGAYGVGDH